MPSLIPTFGIFVAALVVAILWARWDLKRQQAKRLLQDREYVARMSYESEDES